MHIELRERDGNSVLIKRFFHLLVHIKENAPVVPCFAPYGGENIDTALAVFGHAHIRRRVIEDKRMLPRYRGLFPLLFQNHLNTICRK